MRKVRDPLNVKKICAKCEKVLVSSITSQTINLVGLVSFFGIFVFQGVNGPVVDAGDDGIIDFNVFLRTEVLRCFREFSFNSLSSNRMHGRLSSSI